MPQENLAPVIEQVRVRVLPDGRMDRKNAARYMGRAEKTLAMWELEGKGPKSIKVMGRRFYYKETLDAFIRCGAMLALAVFLSVVAIGLYAATFLVA